MYLHAKIDGDHGCRNKYQTAASGEPPQNYRPRQHSDNQKDQKHEAEGDEQRNVIPQKCPAEQQASREDVENRSEHRQIDVNIIHAEPPATRKQISTK